MNKTADREFKPVNIAVLTISDTRTESDDKSGDAIVNRLIESGHNLVEKKIVPDDVYQIRAAVSNWIANVAVQVVISTGGNRRQWSRWLTRGGSTSARQNPGWVWRNVSGVVIR